MMEVKTIYKNTFGLLVSGLIIIFVFGWVLKKETSKFKSTPRNKFDKFLFLLDNIHLIGGENVYSLV